MLRYSKRLLDPNIGIINAHTYRDRELLMGSPEFILQDISEAIDDFVSYFLRVRDSASCADHRRAQVPEEIESEGPEESTHAVIFPSALVHLS